MGKSRKYILNVCDNISCGLGTCTTTDQTYNLLNSFVNDNITYPVLSEEELSVLSKLDYEDRVLNFIDYINIEDSSQKEILFTGATTINDNPDCLSYYCYLNSKFQVYKFFDGIRIINAGEANFVLQYQVYPLSEYNEDQPWLVDDNYPWQTSPTFLGLNSNEVYVIKIRDYSPEDNIVVCEYSQTVSMSLIIGNTTTTITNKVISLTQYTDNLVNDNCFKTGVFSIDPNLLNFQKLTVNYSTNLNGNNNGTSSLILKCRPNGGSEYLNYVDINNNTNGTKNYSQSGSFILNYGDSMCYALSAYAGSGDNSTGILKIDSTSSFGGFNSTINLNACETSISNSKVATTILFSLLPDGNPTSNQSNGKINILPSIPSGTGIINLTVSAITSIATATDGASVSFYKKPIGSPLTNYTLISSFAGNSAQNQKDIVLPISYNEDYCYSLGVNVVNSSQYACVKLKSVDTTATSLSPSIYGLITDKIELAYVIPPKVTVHTYLLPNASDWTYGRIVVDNNELNNVVGNEYKKICVYYCADVAHYYNPSPDADKNMYGSEVIIKRSTVQNPYYFETIVCHVNVRESWSNQGNCTNGTTKGIGSFTINYNDIIEYCVCARSNGGVTTLCLLNVTDGYVPISEGKIDARQNNGKNMLLYTYEGDYCYMT